MWVSSRVSGRARQSSPPAVFNGRRRDPRAGGEQFRDAHAGRTHHRISPATAKPHALPARGKTPPPAENNSPKLTQHTPTTGTPSRQQRPRPTNARQAPRTSREQLPETHPAHAHHRNTPTAAKTTPHHRETAPTEQLPGDPAAGAHHRISPAAAEPHAPPTRERSGGHSLSLSSSFRATANASSPARGAPGAWVT